MNLSSADLAVVAAYFAIVFIVGFFLSRRKKDSASNAEEFILAGRRVTLPFFVASLVATWYGNILGMGEFVYTGGIVAWICFGLPYYAAAVLFALFAAKKIRQMNVRSIPEQIENAYGVRAGRVSSVIVLLMTIPGAYILTLGLLISMFTGWDMTLSIIAGTAASLIYLYTGGFKADVMTNTAQFAFMYIGFGALLFFSIDKFGDISTMASKLPAQHLKPFGGYSAQYVLSWYIIAFQTFIDPGFHQRCSAAINPQTAKRGVLISVLFWIVFDTLTTLTGLYAKAYITTDNPMMAYPLLGDSVLPAVWKGLFAVALLATVMSTLDSYAFISAATFSNDIITPMRKKRGLKEISQKNLTKIGLLLTGVTGVLLAIALPSAVEIGYKTSSIAVPALILPLLVSMSSKFYLERKKAAVLMMISAAVSGFWTLGGYAGRVSPLLQTDFFSIFEPMFPGIIVSFVLGAFFIKKRVLSNVDNP